MSSIRSQGRCSGSLSVLAACAVGLFATAGQAQGVGEQQPVKPPAVQAKAGDAKAGDAKASPADAVADLRPAAQDTSLARVTAEQVQVRCFSSANSPVYEDALPKGAVVQVGAAQGEFRRVDLPLGVVGYVSKKFTSSPEQGMLRTIGSRVSFRYRPTPPLRAEEPVLRLDEGTALKYLGETGDWWRVRHPTGSAYLPIDAIQVFGVANATLQQSHAELARRQQTEWQAAVASYDQAKQLAAERDQQSVRVAELSAAFTAQAGRPMLEQELEPILAEVVFIVGKLPEEAPLRLSALRLQKAVETQRLLVQAERILNDDADKPARPKPQVEIVVAPKDKLAHLENFGWLSYHPRSAGAEAFRLMKGGRVVSYLKCSTMRYDLSMFHGVEIGISGPSRQGELRSYIDVERLEVLGHAR